MKENKKISITAGLASSIIALLTGLVIFSSGINAGVGILIMILGWIGGYFFGREEAKFKSKK